MSPRAPWRPSEWRNGQYAGPPAATSSALTPSLSLFSKLPPDSLRLVLSYTCCLDAVLSLAAAFPGLIPDAMAAEWARDVALGSPWPTHLAVYTNASIYTPDSEWPSYRYLGSPEPNPISAHWVVSDVRGLNDLRYWHAPRRRVCRVCLARPLGAAFSTYTGQAKCPCQPCEAALTVCNQCKHRLRTRPSVGREFVAAIRGCPPSLSRLLSLSSVPFAGRDLFMRFLQCRERSARHVFDKLTRDGLCDEAEQLLTRVASPDLGYPMVSPWRWAETGDVSYLAPIRRLVEAEQLGLLIYPVELHSQLLPSTRGFIDGVMPLEECIQHVSEWEVLSEVIANYKDAFNGALGCLNCLLHKCAHSLGECSPLEMLEEEISLRLEKLTQLYNSRGMYSLTFGSGIDAIRNVSSAVKAAASHRAEECLADSVVNDLRSDCLQKRLDAFRVTEQDPGFSCSCPEYGGPVYGTLLPFPFENPSSLLCISTRSWLEDAPCFDHLALAEWLHRGEDPSAVQQTVNAVCEALDFRGLRISRAPRLVGSLALELRLVAANLSGLNVYDAFELGYSDAARECLVEAHVQVLGKLGLWKYFFDDAPVTTDATILPWFKTRSARDEALQEEILTLSGMTSRQRWSLIVESLQASGLSQGDSEDAVFMSCAALGFVGGVEKVRSVLMAADSSARSCVCSRFDHVVGRPADRICCNADDPCWSSRDTDRDSNSFIDSDTSSVCDNDTSRMSCGCFSLSLADLEAPLMVARQGVTLRALHDLGLNSCKPRRFLASGGDSSGCIIDMSELSLGLAFGILCCFLGTAARHGENCSVCAGRITGNTTSSYRGERNCSSDLKDDPAGLAWLSSQHYGTPGLDRSVLLVGAEGHFDSSSIRYNGMPLDEASAYAFVGHCINLELKNHAVLVECLRSCRCEDDGAESHEATRAKELELVVKEVEEVGIGMIAERVFEEGLSTLGAFRRVETVLSARIKTTIEGTAHAFRNVLGRCETSEYYVSEYSFHGHHPDGSENEMGVDMHFGDNNDDYYYDDYYDEYGMEVMEFDDNRGWY